MGKKSRRKLKPSDTVSQGSDVITQLTSKSSSQESVQTDTTAFDLPSTQSTITTKNVNELEYCESVDLPVLNSVSDLPDKIAPPIASNDPSVCRNQVEPTDSCPVSGHSKCHSNNVALEEGPSPTKEYMQSVSLPREISNKPDSEFILPQLSGCASPSPSDPSATAAGLPTHTLSQSQSPCLNGDEAVRLHDQLNQLSRRLIAAQDQIDKLLEEKRSWLQSSSQSASGELRGRWLQAKTLAETYKHEKENMVVKYAQSEQKRIHLENRIRELESISQKIHPANSTNSSVPLSCPVNGADSSERHADDGREWEQRTAQLQKDLLAAREQIDSLRKTNITSESRAIALEKRLNQTNESLRSEQQKVSSLNITVSRLNRSLETALKDAKDAERLREREAERLCAEMAYQEAQQKLRSLTADNDVLRKQLGEMETLKVELDEGQLRLSELLSENAIIPELRSDLDRLRQHEEHLCDVTRKLTEQNVQLQAEHLALSNRVTSLDQQLREQEASIHGTREEAEKLVTCERTRSEGLENQLNELQAQLQQLRDREAKLLADLISEREQATLTHKRDAGRIRDLTRQLARAAHPPRPPQPALSECSNMMEHSFDDVYADNLRSPTISVHSIESNGPTNHVAGTTSAPNVGDTLMATGLHPTVDHNQPSSTTNGAVDQFDEAERVAWLGKIDRLQRAQLRLTDKVEFLQEHCWHLTEEIGRKSQIIQSLLLTDQQAGSASPPSVDQNRERISRTGGLMASLYTGKVSKEAPDRDTCLEISQKLQVVLEDSLFKNITYKDNMNTLGSEISRLNKVLSDIHAELCDACRIRTADLFRPPPMSFKP